MNVYMPPSLHRFQPLRAPFGTWGQSLPLIYDLVAALRPGVIAGLGIYHGTVHCAASQAVLEHDTDTLCYAVGEWLPGEDAAEVAEEVYDDLCFYNRVRYGAFSYVLRMPSSQALQHFSDGGIDLLHCDGAVSPRDVAAELAQWYPRLGAGGLALVRGVPRAGAATLQQRLREVLPRGVDIASVEGERGAIVVRKPGDEDAELPETLQWMFGPDTDHEGLGQIYAAAVDYLALNHRIDFEAFNRMRQLNLAQRKG